MGRVIVVGSINRDLVVRVPRLPRAGETVIGGEFAALGGGKGANQAAAAASYGADVALVGAVGDDDPGAAALAELSRIGADVSGVERVAGAATGIALIVVDGDGHNQIAVASGANASLTAGGVSAALARLAPGPGDVLLTSFELADGVVLTAVNAARRAGATAILNPAPARSLLDAIVACGPILTPNEPEALALTGLPDPESAARALLERTGSPCVVTLGERGALLMEAMGRAVRLAAARVSPVDATGAGDALNGILAAELAKGTSLAAAAALAVAGASISTEGSGARGRLPSAAEVAARRPGLG